MVRSQTSLFIAIVLISFYLALTNACSPQVSTPALIQPASTPMLSTITLSPPTSSPRPTESATAEVIELNPSPRGYVSMAYDTESKQVILFGGQTGDFSNPANFSDETWAYDVTTNIWKEMKPSLAPKSGGAGSLVYDVESDRIILFGATRGVSPSGDTWAYDFNSNSWSQMAAKGPINRLGLRMAYDIESDQIILFGGYNANRDEMYQNTWAYDFNSDTWTDMKPATNPPGQNFHSMTYDVKTDRVVLWGGDTETGNSRPPKDPSVWVYDYNTNTWEQKLTSDGPGARAYGAMAYDMLSDQTILYGGYTIGSNEMWAYNYNTNIWTKLESSMDPGRLSRHAFVYVPDIDRFILFGGQVGSDQYLYTQSTWVYDFNANTWTDVTRQP